MKSNKALHLTAIPLHSIAARELCSWTFEMKNILLILLLGALLLSGCASTGVSIQQQLDAMVGTVDKSACIEKFGLPDKTLALDSREIWEYKLNLHKYTSTTGYRFSTYDLLRLTFENEIVKSWSIKHEVK